MRLAILPGLRVYQHCYTTVLLKPKEWLPTTITTRPQHVGQVGVAAGRDGLCPPKPNWLHSPPSPLQVRVPLRPSSNPGHSKRARSSASAERGNGRPRRTPITIWPPCCSAGSPRRTRQASWPVQTPKAPITGLFADPRLNHQAIGPLTYPTPSTSPSASASKREAWPRPFAALDIELLRFFSPPPKSKCFSGGAGQHPPRLNTVAGVGEEISPKTRTMAFFFSKLLVSRGISLEKCSEKYIMYINSKKQNKKKTRTNKQNKQGKFSFLLQ